MQQSQVNNSQLYFFNKINCIPYKGNIRTSSKTVDLSLNLQRNAQLSAPLDGPPPLEYSSEAFLTNLMNSLERERIQASPPSHRIEENDPIPSSLMLHTHHSENEDETTSNCVCKDITFPKILSTCVCRVESPHSSRFFMKVVLQQLVYGKKASCSKLVTVRLPLLAQSDEWGIIWLESVSERGCIIADGLHVSRTLLERSVAKAAENGVFKRVAPYVFGHLTSPAFRKELGVYAIPELPRHVFVGPYVAGYLARKPFLQSLFLAILTTKEPPNNRVLHGSPVVVDLADSPVSSHSSVLRIASESRYVFLLKNFLECRCT